MWNSAQDLMRRGVVALAVLMAGWWLAGWSAGAEEGGAIRIVGAGEEGVCRVRVDAGEVLWEGDRHLLLGTNIAGWFEARQYNNPQLREAMRALGPTLIRLPGGSWGDVTMWNGHGVRVGDWIDESKFVPEPFSEWSAPWGWWRVDYSDYAPGFLLDHQGRANREWHGHVDVKFMHDFIEGVGGRALVILNGGLGTPVDAAEWVRWAKKCGYKVSYWEVGNELGGSWEAGHFLPGGKRLNGYIFSRRYEEFAKAVKAVDPQAKVGCMDWIEDVLEYCGPLVDFISIHTYPWSGAEERRELFEKAERVPRHEVGRVRAAIQRYQGERAGQIEIGYSEWNVDHHGIEGALWHAIWLGRLMEEGVSFANQFPLFDMVRTVGEDEIVPRGYYWVRRMWREYMDDVLVKSEIAGAEDKELRVFATRSAERVSVMLINISESQERRVELVVEGLEVGEEGGLVRLSPREYWWVDREPGQVMWRKPEGTIWNKGLAVWAVAWGREGRWVVVPPMSVVVCVLPAVGQRLELKTSGRVEALEPRLEMLLPEEGYANTAVEVPVWVCNGESSEPYPESLGDAQIEIEGPAKADRERLRLAEAAGRFVLEPQEPGEVKVTVRAGGAAVSRMIRFMPSVPKPVVFWEFEEEELPRYIRSHWKLESDASERANQRVARVDLDGAAPSQEKREVLVIEQLPGPERLKRANVRGAFFDLKVSEDFRCEDPEARVQVVMQSPANWWMVLGEAKLSECRGWKSWSFVTERPEYVRAMPQVFNLWLILLADRPVYGAIYVDRAGLMVR